MSSHIPVMHSQFSEEVLSYISDDKPLGAHLARPAVKQIVEGYTRFAEINDQLPLITEDSSGWDFKQAVGQLTPAQQVSLYYPYLRSISPAFEEQENPAEARSRIRMREFYIKFSLYTVYGLIAMLAGAAIVIAVRSGKAPSSQVFETFFKTATDIAEVIFSSGRE